MKILHIGKFYPPFFGGMETYLQQLAYTQQQAGLQVEVLVHRHDGAEDVYEDGDMGITRVGTRGKLLFTPIAPGFRGALRRVILRFQPQVLHLHLPNPSAFWAMTLPEAKSIPWVVHWHSDVVSSLHDRRVRLAYPFYRPFEQALLQRAARIIATSEPYLHTSAPLSSWVDKVAVVPLGMSSVDTLAISGSTRWGEGLRVLAAGRFTYYKGFSVLIRALARVQNIQLVLVGSGELESELNALVGQFGLWDRVQMPGQLPNQQLRALMSSSDLICLPSIERTEAFGMVLLEAASCGKPALISDVPGSGMGFVVEQGVTGLKVQPADVDALAEGLRALAADPERLAEMGRNAQARFDRLFRIERGERQIAAIYEDLLH